MGQVLLVRRCDSCSCGSGGAIVALVICGFSFRRFFVHFQGLRHRSDAEFLFYEEPPVTTECRTEGNGQLERKTETVIRLKRNGFSFEGTFCVGRYTITDDTFLFHF